MGVFVGTKRLQKAAPKNDQRAVVRELVQAVDEALLTAANRKGSPTTPTPTPLSSVPHQLLSGGDPNVLFVLQAEAGAVQWSDGPVSASTLPTTICSLDATTCLIVAFRHARTHRVALAHFDHGGEQAETGVKMLADLALQSCQARSTDKEVLEAYFVGTVQFPKFSQDTLASVLANMGTIADVDFHVRLDGCCVWTQNTSDAHRCVHRGLLVDAKDGSCKPVESDVARAYPEVRLRGLRCMQAEHLTSISISRDEEMLLRRSDASTVATASAVPWIAATRAHMAAQHGGALPHLIVIRPFTWSRFMPDVARKPMDEFLRMSTTPEMEPDDFAVQLKAAIVYGHLYRPEVVFADSQPLVYALVAKSQAAGDAARRPGPPPCLTREETDKTDPMVGGKEFDFVWVQVYPATQPPVA